MRNEQKRARASGASGQVNPFVEPPPFPLVSSLQYSITPFEREQEFIG